MGCGFCCTGFDLRKCPWRCLPLWVLLLRIGTRHPGRSPRGPWVCAREFQQDTGVAVAFECGVARVFSVQIPNKRKHGIYSKELCLQQRLPKGHPPLKCADSGFLSGFRGRVLLLINNLMGIKCSSPPIAIAISYMMSHMMLAERRSGAYFLARGAAGQSKISCRSRRCSSKVNARVPLVV